MIEITQGMLIASAVFFLILAVRARNDKSLL